MKDGFYIVENDGEVTVLELSNGEWYDTKTGQYASYTIKPTRVIERIELPAIGETKDRPKQKEFDHIWAGEYKPESAGKLIYNAEWIEPLLRSKNSEAIARIKDSNNE